MRPLLINDEVKAMVDRVVAHARANPIPLVTVVRMMNGDEAPIGDISEANRCIIPMGYRCVYSVEVQPMGKFGHLSVSVDAKGKAPHEGAFFEIAKLFGFTVNQPKDFAKVWVEDLPNGICAVNGLQELEMSWKK